MVAVGASIVFSGLAVLSFTIAQLHKILNLWDQRETLIEKFKRRGQKESCEIPPRLELTADVQETVRQFKLLTQRLGEPFPLPRLLHLSEKCGFTKPHSTLNKLLTAKIIIPDGKGYFRWYY